MPVVGEIKLRRSYPLGTPLTEITEFDIWDGERWVPAEEAQKQVYVVEDPGD